MLKLMESLSNHTSKVWCVCWNYTGDKFASCGGDKNVNIWRFTNKEVFHGFKSTMHYIIPEAHKRTIREVTFSPCGKFIAMASFDGTASIWEENKKKNGYDCITTVEGHDNEVKSITWSPSGQYFATCGRDKSVMIWSLHAEDDNEVECECVLTVHSQDVKRVKWHPNEDILVSASYDNTVKFYQIDKDNSDWVVTATLEGHDSTVWGVDFDKTGNRVVTCSDDRTLKIWSKVADDKWLCTNTLVGFHERPIYDVSWSPHDGLIATACGDDCIRIFKENTSANSVDGQNTFDCLVTVTAHKGDVNRLSWNPKSPGVLVSGADDAGVKLWKWIEQ